MIVGKILTHTMRTESGGRLGNPRLWTRANPSNQLDWISNNVSEPRELVHIPYLLYMTVAYWICSSTICTVVGV